MKTILKTNRKAFTLVELLIVIAIIGILFVVLVSKVDFATDKANATGVQTDFRSFQVAFETVSRENAGFNTLGWDTGDKADASLIAGYTYLNADKDAGDRVRNSYDKGDMNLNGICEEGETWVGQKLYTETWTGIYTLNNPADTTDMSAYLALERAINKNLDPALRVSIDPENQTIYMANGYQDPWKTEYHGFYLTNANIDGMDRGAIVMYSDGPNKVFGSEQTITKGIVTVTVKNGGINGQDDLSLVTCYTYTNGYGEIGTTTFGFSTNQQMQVGGGNGGPSVVPIVGEGGYTMLDKPTAPLTNVTTPLTLRSEAPYSEFKSVKVNNEIVDPSNYTVTEGSTIITFNPEYLETLPNGNYKIEIISEKGSAKCDIEIKAPKLTKMFIYAESPVDKAWLGAKSFTTIEMYDDGQEYKSAEPVTVGQYVGGGQCNKGKVYIVAKYNNETNTYDYRYLFAEVTSDAYISDSELWKVNTYYGETGTSYGDILNLTMYEQDPSIEKQEMIVLINRDGAYVGDTSTATIRMKPDGKAYISDTTIKVGCYLGGGECNIGTAYLVAQYDQSINDYKYKLLIATVSMDQIWNSSTEAYAWNVGDIVSINDMQIFFKNKASNLEEKQFEIHYWVPGCSDSMSSTITVKMLNDGNEYMYYTPLQTTLRSAAEPGQSEEFYLFVKYNASTESYSYRILLSKSPNDPYNYSVGTYYDVPVLTSGPVFDVNVK